MALEQQIIRFFGAGLAALGARRLDLALPTDAVAGSLDLVDRLVAGGMGPNPRDLLTAIARDMRALISAGRFPVDEIERHMRVLPELLATHPPELTAIAAAIAYYATHEPGKPNGQEPPALAIARSVADRAEASGALARLDLDPVLTARLIELLFGRVLADARYLEGVQSALDALAPTQAEPVAATTAGYEDEDAQSLASPGPAGSEEHVALIDQPDDRLPQDLASLLKRLNATADVPLAALAAMLSAQARRGAEHGRIESALKEKAQSFRDLVRRIGRASTGDSIVQRLRSEATVALDEGKFDETDALLSGVEARLLTGSIAAGADVVERSRAAAELRSQRGALEELRLDYQKAARHYEAAAGCLAESDLDGRWSCTLRQGAALQADAEEFGDSEALVAAIVIYARALEQSPRQHAADRWAVTQNHLGNALMTLGDREGSPEKLALAEKSYRLALEIRTRKDTPEEWALLNSNLGTALLKRGEIEGGAEHFRQAAFAFGEALKEFSREHTPADWALTQMNLATALSRLAAHDDDIRPLEGAASAFTAALEEIPRDERPDEWARLENSLGNVLSELGERTGDGRWLELANTAYRATLEIWSRDRAPLQWALATANLGNALWALGELRSDPALLGEAADVILTALDVFRELGETQYEQTALDNLRALRETLARLGVRSAVGG